MAQKDQTIKSLQNDVNEVSAQLQLALTYVVMAVDDGERHDDGDMVMIMVVVMVV